jgi:ribonucleotide reductase alpha subunit
MHKTKWPEGWLPIDTMNKNVFKVVKQPLLQDWETLRKEVVENGGIRNSCLINFMPNESSSVATNGTNSILPARAVKVVKTNGSKMTRFLVPNSDTLADKYELAWDIKTRDLIDVYACIQAFTDQSISADIYLDFTKGDITGVDMMKDWLYQTSMGMKTRYYINSKTNSGKKEEKAPEVEQEVGCGGGGCSL